MEGRVGFFVTNLHGYHGKVLDEVRPEAERLGMQMEVFDAQNNAIKQAKDLVSFAFAKTSGRECVFVVPEGDASYAGEIDHDPTLQQARRLLKKGIGYVLMNHGREEIIATLRTEFPTLPVGIVAVDDAEFGRVQGRQVRALLPNGGIMLCVLGNPFDSASRDRSRALRQELEGHGVTIEEVDGRWHDDHAFNAVHKWVISPSRRNRPLDAVVAQNDYMGFGARRALLQAAEELGRDDLATLPVLGGDGLPDVGIRWVEDGTLTATVKVTLPGRVCLDRVVRYWTEGTPFPPVTRLPVKSFPDEAILAKRARP
jgi:hypothetical protein